MSAYRFFRRSVCGVLIAVAVAVGIVVLPAVVWVPVVLLAIVIALTVHFGRPAARTLVAREDRAPRAGPPAAPVSTSQLCREWHESYIALNEAQTSAARLRIVMARQRCLDELERRDPEGLHAWLASSTSSAGGDPSRFLTGSRSDTPPDQHLS